MPGRARGRHEARYSAALVIAAELSGCGSRLLHGSSFLDWFGFALIVLVIIFLGVGFVGLSKTIRK